MRYLILNPITLWLRWVCMKSFLERRNRVNKLKIHYMAHINNCQFGQHNVIYNDATLNEVSMGDYSYVAANSQIARASIGKFCCIGPDVMIGLGKHPTRDFVSIHPIFYSEKKQSGTTFADKSYYEEYASVSIGNDVWVGARSIIVDGVTVGDGAVIAAGSIVVADVPPYAIVGGVPAKLIKYRFNVEEIELLKSFSWWDKGDEWLRRHYKEFHHIDRIMQCIRGANDDLCKLNEQ